MKVKVIIHISKREFERNTGGQSESNPNMFWSHVRHTILDKTFVDFLTF